MNSEELNAKLPYATPEELAILKDLVQDFTLVSEVVVIGAGPGVMLLAMREANEHFLATLIDNTTCYYAQRHLEDAGLDRRVVYVVSDSSSFGNIWLNSHQIDLLVVDGDHSYEGVKKDLDAWLPKVKVGGHVFVHDFDPRGTRFETQENYPGVAIAVVDSDLINDNWKHLGRFGTAVVLRRDS